MQKDNILILGASGFIGKNLFCNLNKKKYTIFTLDKKKLFISKNHFQKKIQNININHYIKKYKISLIIDCIGLSSHDFTSPFKIKKNFFDNFFVKRQLLNNLEETKKKIFYISLGSLYKFGKINKLKETYKKPMIFSSDIQALGKFIFESSLFSIKNKNIHSLVINLGSVYGGGNKNNSLNFIDQIILAKQKKIKFKIYINKRRYKNIMHIDDLCEAVVSIILKKKKLSKFYQEYNLIGKLFDFETLKNFNNFQFVNSNSNDLKNFYFINKKPKCFNLFNN
jgi:nucleoside-diphosphate-sugar epimerase